MTTLPSAQQATIAATVQRMQPARGLGDAENAAIDWHAINPPALLERLIEL